jgi:bifunctional enzyme CysN/CysC
VRLTTTQPFYYDPYQINRATGAFILIDPFTNNTVAAGMIRREAQNLEDLVSAEPERRKSSNVVWEGSALTRAMREERNGHKGAVLWFTGLSGSGKSTVARLLERRLYAAGVQTFYWTATMCATVSTVTSVFPPRIARRTSAAWPRSGQAGLRARQRGDLHLHLPFAADRDFARTLIPDPHFLEIYVKCDLEVVKRRDPKGLYARALRGEIPSSPASPRPMKRRPLRNWWWRRTCAAPRRSWRRFGRS